MTVTRKGPAKAAMKKALAKAPVSLTRTPSGYATWLADVKACIHPAQQRVALAVNREMTTSRPAPSSGGSGLARRPRKAQPKGVQTKKR